MNRSRQRMDRQFYDTSKTSAEIVTGLYQAIYEAAKKHHTLIMGCNTIGHLGGRSDAAAANRRRYQRYHLGENKENGSQHSGILSATAWNIFLMWMRTA